MSATRVFGSSCTKLDSFVCGPATSITVPFVAPALRARVTRTLAVGKIGTRNMSCVHPAPPDLVQAAALSRANAALLAERDHMIGEARNLARVDPRTLVDTLWA